jgi:hypothetical protein
MKISSSFDGMIKTFGLFKVAMKTLDTALKGVEKLFNSTAEGQ